MLKEPMRVVSSSGGEEGVKSCWSPSVVAWICIGCSVWVGGSIVMEMQPAVKLTVTAGEMVVRSGMANFLL